jgi:signal peptidase I
MEEKKQQKNVKDVYQGVGSFVIEIVKIFLLAFLIIVPIRIFLFQPFFVQGASMEPNFEDNEYLIITELGYKQTEVKIGSNKIFKVNSFKDIERQTVLVFRYPNDRNKYFIKRVIGLPNERVEIKNGVVKIYNRENPNGFILDESAYLAKTVETMGDLSMQLNEDQYFVMGDNRRFSSDSRAWGPISKADVIGKVLLRAWPVNNLEIF